MKRTFKRILPILLAIVIICSMIWYLFVYDQDFTRDVLLSGARYFDDQGNHSIAAWLYDQAYHQASNNETVAIELSNRFKELGNYTKAESTLTGAIADGGSAELYIALSKTYVEQDKLLDAVTMMDNITDPAIKAELDALRPAAPTVDAEPGFYNTYLPITISAETGTLYVTTDGEYPSTAQTPSDGALTLVSGENTIYALCVGDNGLVSSLSIFGYTVGGVIEEVTLADPTIDAIARQTLGLAAGDPIFSNQLWSITTLALPEGAESYEDLSRLSYLESLTIQGNLSDSLAGLESLSQLKELVITDSKVSQEDLMRIASLPALEKLTLSGCSLSGIDPLSDARKLTSLDLSNNAIRDVSPLSFMSALNQLDLSHNALDNLNALSALSSLETLNVSYNALTSVFPLSSCIALTELRINNNTVAALTGLEKLTALTLLDASYNSLTEVTPLSQCLALQWLDVSSNALTDITALSSLRSLKTFAFSRNQVVTLPAWDSSCALVTIDGSHNRIQSVSGLGGLENLNQVLMDYNEISNVDALAKCHNLIRVSVFGNPVRDVSALTDMSVIVNYNPL